MELKELFGNQSLTFEQFQAKVDEAKMKLADLSGGAYVAKGKFDESQTAVASLKEQIAQRDKDLAEMKAQLEGAKADASGLEEAKAKVASLTSKYEEANKNFEAKLLQAEKTFAIREQAQTINFTSEAARRDFVSQAGSLEYKDGHLVEFEAFLKKYTDENKGAILDEKDPHFVGGTKAPSGTVQSFLDSKYKNNPYYGK